MLSSLFQPSFPSSCPFDLPGPQYRLEKQSEPNVAVDLESTLESQSAWEFCLVRENSTLATSLRACFVRYRHA